MCNHYRASGEWRTKVDEISQTKIVPRFDLTSPRPNVQGDDVFPAYVGEILTPQEDGRLVATASTWLYTPPFFLQSIPDLKGVTTFAQWKKVRGGCNNATAETADRAYPFNTVAKTGRCLIPGEAFFEWDDAVSKAKGGPGKTEYRFAYPDGRAFFFGGLCGWSEHEDTGPLLTYTMVTKPAGGDTNSIGHKRQPVTLLPDEIEAWLNPERPIVSFKDRLDPAGTFTVTPVKGPKAMQDA